jgi:hypothetical protein
MPLGIETYELERPLRRSTDKAAEDLRRKRRAVYHREGGASVSNDFISQTPAVSECVKHFGAVRIWGIVGAALAMGWVGDQQRRRESVYLAY